MSLNGSATQVRETFLDGLRGWAALNVVIVHFFFDTLAPIDVEKMHPQYWWPASGSLSVALFFVISGYALSVGFLSSGSYLSLARMAAGRYVRLTIPILALCCFVSALFACGIIVRSNLPPDFSEFFAFELTASNLLKFSLYDVYFDYDPHRSYAGPLWTMSYELIGSALVFALLFSKFLRRQFPIIMCAGALFVWAPLLSLFVVGVIFAASQRHITALIPQRVAWTLIVFGLILWRFQPANHHVYSASAILLFVGVAASSTTRRIMSSRASVALGDLSFPLYLVHAPIMFAVGIPLLRSGQAWLAAPASLAISVIVALLFAPINSFASWAARAFGRAVFPSRQRTRTAD